MSDADRRAPRMPAGSGAAGTRPARGGQPALAGLDPAFAAAVAEIMQALAAPSRLLILARLWRTPCSVGTLVADVGMTQSAVSHQLRLLRQLGLVTATRQGKKMIYALYDEHVAMLLDAAVRHSAHRRSAR